jgi:hypothetical protein
MLAEYGYANRMIYGTFNCSNYRNMRPMRGHRNPYWLLYDQLKNEERDDRTFIELLRSIECYGDQTR